MVLGRAVKTQSRSLHAQDLTQNHRGMPGMAGEPPEFDLVIKPHIFANECFREFSSEDESAYERGTTCMQSSIRILAHRSRAWAYIFEGSCRCH